MSIFRKTIELYDQARHADFAHRFGQDPRASAEIVEAVTLWVLGRVDDALRLADRALADATSAAHAPTMGYVLAFAARLGFLRYSPEVVATYSHALADIVSRFDLPAFWGGLAVFFQGWAKWSDGSEESGLTQMRRGLAINREQGIVRFLPNLEAALAEGEASADDTDAGLKRLDDALAELERTERWYEAEMHRIRAEILLKRDPADTASAQQALQIRAPSKLPGSLRTQPYPASALAVGMQHGARRRATSSRGTPRSAGLSTLRRLSSMETSICWTATFGKWI